MARDAGAAAALSPVARTLIRDGRLGVSIVAFGQAAGIFRERGLPVLAFSESPTREQVESLLAREGARVVLTGTSMEASKDAAFWDAARTAGIPSIALVDHWCNYSERFTSEAPFDAVPDTIAVMDEAAAAALQAEGCPPGLLLVTGQPHFDEVIRDSATLSRTEVRQELDVDPVRPLLVFASEPQGRYYGNALGYDEQDALGALLESAAAVAPDAQVVVKLHPLEQPDAFSDLPETERRVAVRVVRAYPPEHLIRAADIVLGMTSVLLLEAVLTGTPTISIRPGGGEDHFLSVHADKIVSVTDAKSLPEALERALRQGVQDAPPGGSFGARAIERTVGAVYELARVPEAAAR
jgi:Capsule polysaccharide biosynthesis protein